MYIAKVLSNLDAWNSFQERHPDLYTEFCDVIESIQPQRTAYSKEKARSAEKLISAQSISRQFMKQFRAIGWSEKRINFGDSSKSGFSEIDAAKEKIGLELSFVKFAFTESNVFVKFPIFVRAEIINFAILITPVTSLVREMMPGISSFEMVQRRLKEISPLLPKYPFVIVGVSHQPAKMEVQELTSPLDNYLIETLGFSLLDMKMQAERPNYDFKIQLPDENQKVAKEICALANTKNGGLILVGIDDNGNLLGFPRNKLDEMQRRIIQIGTQTCMPSPKIECTPFDVPSNSENSMLVVQISELEQKPCMTSDKVFIRAGTMARAANSEEIRRLLLGSVA